MEINEQRMKLNLKSDEKKLLNIILCQKEYDMVSFLIELKFLFKI